MVTVLSQPGCHACEQTKAYLSSHNIPFEDKNIREDEQALHQLEALGYAATPVVVAGDQHWAGFDPEKLATLVH